MPRAPSDYRAVVDLHGKHTTLPELADHKNFAIVILKAKACALLQQLRFDTRQPVLSFDALVTCNSSNTICSPYSDTT